MEKPQEQRHDANSTRENIETRDKNVISKKMAQRRKSSPPPPFKLWNECKSPTMQKPTESPPVTTSTPIAKIQRLGYSQCVSTVPIFPLFVVCLFYFYYYFLHPTDLSFTMHTHILIFLLRSLSLFGISFPFVVSSGLVWSRLAYRTHSPTHRSVPSLFL